MPREHYLATSGSPRVRVAFAWRWRGVLRGRVALARRWHKARGTRVALVQGAWRSRMALAWLWWRMWSTTETTFPEDSFRIIRVPEVPRRFQLYAKLYAN